MSRWVWLMKNSCNKIRDRGTLSGSNKNKKDSKNNLSLKENLIFQDRNSGCGPREEWTLVRVWSPTAYPVKAVSPTILRTSRKGSSPNCISSEGHLSDWISVWYCPQLFIQSRQCPQLVIQSRQGPQLFIQSRQGPQLLIQSGQCPQLLIQSGQCPQLFIQSGQCHLVVIRDCIQLHIHAVLVLSPTAYSVKGFVSNCISMQSGPFPQLCIQSGPSPQLCIINSSQLYINTYMKYIFTSWKWFFLSL